MAIKPTVEAIGDEALTNSIIDRSITEIEDDYVTTLAPYALASCTSLKKAVFGSVTEVLNKSFYGDTALETLDFHATVEFDASALQGLSSLKALILRSNTMCDASSGAVLSYTPIEEGTGYIYVPAALVDEYRSDFVWSSYYDQIRAIEDYPEVCDPYSWEAVEAALSNGTYKDVYAVGDVIPVDLGSEGETDMQLVAFDTDVLPDGAGTAAMSWLSVDLLNTASTHSTNWSNSPLRTHLAENIKPLLPGVVAGMVQPVNKTQQANVDGSVATTTTTDELWIPSIEEVYSRRNAAAVVSGIFYSPYTNGGSLIKPRIIGSSGSGWWTRSVRYSDATKVHCFNAAGTDQQIVPGSNVFYICLGFCTGRTPK